MGTAMRAVPMHRDYYEAFIVHQTALTGVGMTTPLCEAIDLDECLSLISAPHKAIVMILHTDTFTGKVMHKFYSVKRKSRGVRRHHDYETRTVRDEYLEHLFDLAGRPVT